MWRRWRAGLLTSLCPVVANNSIRHVELTGGPKRCRLFRAGRESHGLQLISAMVSRSVLRANAKGAISPAGEDLMAQGKILRLQRQSSSEARPQGMKQDANDRFHGVARLPAEGANRNDFNAVGIIGMHRASFRGFLTAFLLCRQPIPAQRRALTHPWTGTISPPRSSPRTCI